MRIRWQLENNEGLKDQNIRFITGLTQAEIRSLIEEQKIELSLFTCTAYKVRGNRELAEVSDDNYRYVLSVNPDLEYKQIR